MVKRRALTWNGMPLSLLDELGDDVLPSSLQQIAACTKDRIDDQVDWFEGFIARQRPGTGTLLRPLRVGDDSWLDSQLIVEP